MTQKGFLLVLMQPPPAFEEEFNAWYDTDHIPERLNIPGFETARRYVCLAGSPRYLALYDLQSASVLESAAYRRFAGENYTPWTRRVLSHVRSIRAAGTQRHPGDATTTQASRLLLLRFRDVRAEEEAPLLAGLRAGYAHRPETAQLRLLAEPTARGADCYAVIEARAPFAEPGVDPAVLGACADRLDLVNFYAAY